MKYLIILSSVLLSGLIACENMGGTLVSKSNDSAKAMEAAPARDMSITSANSYSDLFLDSIAIENYISQQKLPDSLARGIRNFYTVRNFQFAWFYSQGITEQGKGLWSLYDYANDHGDSIKENKALVTKMDTVMEADTLLIASSDSGFIQTELSLTKEFLKYSSTFKNHIGFTDPYHFVPARKTDVLQLADSVLNLKSDSFSGTNTKRPYFLLKQELQKYYNVAQKGGWQSIPVGTTNLKKGNSSPLIVAIKKRLVMTGELQSTDTSNVYNDSLQAAIINYKIHHGFDSSARLSDSVISDMNIPVTQRIEQILINMNRMMWMPDINTDRAIEVNIPEFMLNVYEGTAKAFNMKVVVGKEGASTTMFTGDLNQVVFSPYWNIPQSITRDEIMPKVKDDPNYLQKHHMEIVKKSDSLPVIRQVPGADNPLGKVKFLFPNSYEIFFHDTPKKELFEKDKRAYSHGCIRLENAKQLASYLLKDDASWTPEKIDKAMNSGKEQFVKLKKSVPVVITYLTTWVDENGQLNFRDDVYKHDSATSQRLFTTASLSQPVQQDSARKDTGKRNI